MSETNEAEAVEEIDAGGILEVLDPTGHFEVRWGKKKSEVDAAEATFNDLLSKGYLAFKKTWLGRKGKSMESFDPSAGAAIFDEPGLKPVPLPVVDPKDEARKAEEKAKKDAEDAKKQERIDETKRACDAAAEAVKNARCDHEKATRLRRETNTAKSDAERELREATGRLGEATRKREEAAKKLEAAARPQVTPTPVSEIDQAAAALTETASQPAPPPDGDGAKREYDEVVAAEAIAKSAREAATTRVEEAKKAWEAAAAEEKFAYEKKKEVEKVLAEKDREHDDAMTDLHGEPTNEQTREFDKKAKTTVTPPMRGG